MAEKKARKTLDKKTVIAIIVVATCLALVALSAAIAGHTIYVENSEAKILNYNTAFKATTPQTLTYVYDDGVQSIDFSKIIEVSKGATFSIQKIQDEDMTVSKGTGCVLDVSEKSQRLALVSVVSKNGVGKTDYRITVVPASSENNVVDFNVPDAELNPDDVFLNYSGDYSIGLPTPVKTYTGLSGNTYEYDFLGWYTTADFEEGTEIDKIEKGTSGAVSVYARFADNSAPTVRDGYTYVTFGSYPQTQVTEYALYNEIKRSDAFKNAGNASNFSYGGKTYYKYTPVNVPNLSANGYSSSSTYVFYVEPVEWRVLTAKGVTPSGTVTLLSDCILNCSAYSTNDETVMKKLYNTLDEKNININSFMRYFFDGDTAYGMEDNGGNELKKAMDSLANSLFTSAERSKITDKTFNRYKLAGSGTESYTCTLWPINYSDAINSAYGFNTDYRNNDPLRKAMVTDFAAANGVYRATSTAHKGQGTWWLRSAGGTQGAEYGDAARGYGYKDKRVAYVKYTGYVHAYGSLNNNIRSGVRPAVTVANYSSLIS